VFKTVRFSCRRIYHLAWCAITVATLSACGGDGGGDTTGTTDTISAISAIAPPVISSTPATVVEVGAEYRYVPSVSNAQGSALSFEITNQPSWATFDSATGELEGIPNSSDLGTSAAIEIVVSNGASNAIIGPFRIKIVPASSLNQGGQPPTIGGTAASMVVAGQAYAFAPAVTNPDNQSLSFAVINRPAWATFNPATGELSGTPTSANIGTFANIVISVSDGPSTSSLAAFTITVAAPSGQAPTISGAPPTSANAGTAYSFTPTTTDPSGNTLTFSVEGLPAWAAFNAQTGALSGTPGTGDIGSYANIVISVSDGSSSASLAPFGITVTQGGSGTATLSWSAPTENTNGTPVTNLAGYHIYYGTSATHLNQTERISDAGATTYTVDNLTSGTWYFSINAYTGAGAESAVSNVASLTIP
jgi:hypothetical protein